MKRIASRCVAIFAILTNIIFFQNCSGGFQTASSTSLSSLRQSAASRTEPVISNTPVNISVPTPTPIPSPVFTPAPVVTPKPSPTPTPTVVPMPTPVIQPPSANQIPVFMGQGYVGRRMLSCDLGQSWIYDQSDDNETTACFGLSPTRPDRGNCDEVTGDRPTGIAYGGGYFYADWGWGVANKFGPVRRSVDGVNWEVVKTGTTSVSFSGVAYLPPTASLPETIFEYAGDSNIWSLDGTKSWISPTGGQSISPFVANWNNIRAVGASSTTLFASFDDSPGASIPSITYSVDRGLHWLATTQTAGTSPLCGIGGGVPDSFAEGNGVVVMSSVANDNSNPIVCYSTNGGANWTPTKVSVVPRSGTLFDGKMFYIYGSGGNGTQRLQSSDGKTWTAQNVQFQTASGAATSGEVGLVSYGNGAFVGVTGNWGAAYEYQKFYRSTDGLNFKELPSTAYKGGHPLRFMKFGYVNRSTLCP